MATYVSAETASQERLARTQLDSAEGRSGKRMNTVWRALWWVMLVNMLVFWGITGIIAAM